MSPNPEKLTARQQRQLERWEKLSAANFSWGVKWRSPARTRILICGYYLSLAVAALAVIALLIVPPAPLILVAVFLVAIVAQAVFWTMLRASIEMKDTAPLAALDEYEASIVSHWHTVSSRLMGWLLLAYALIILLLVAIGGAPLNPVGFITALALGIILISLLPTSLPAVGYALTFHTTEEE